MYWEGCAKTSSRGLNHLPTTRAIFCATATCSWAGRGTRNPAVTFLADPGNTIAAANLFVLRPRGSALPDYLAWFLNLPATQVRLGAMRAGSSVPFVRLNELRELEVPVPDLELQKRIVEIYKLSLQEEELLARIQTQRRTLVDAMLHDAVRRETSRAD